MKAVILAAGTASRLRPLTDNKPKCLLQVGSRTLLQRTIDALSAAGIKEYVVVTGYLHQMIEQYLIDNYPDLIFHFVYNERYLSTNNIYSLWLCEPWVNKQDFLLADSDILFDPAIIPELLSQQGSVLALNRHKCGEEEIKIIADPQHRVLEISKTCSPADALGESVGLEKIDASYSKALFEELRDMILGPKGLDNVFYELAFERLIPKGHVFRYVDTSRYFSIELDTPEDFAQAQCLIPPTLY